MNYELSMHPFILPANTQIGSVYLRVSYLDRALSFYQGLLGFRLMDQTGETAILSASGNPPAQVVLISNPKVTPKEPHTTGLYHVAIRLPNRQALGILLKRLIENQWALYGGADHLVSEALYLADQDGNGIELYVDKPRESWPYENGSLVMGSEPLNYRALLQEATAVSSPWGGIHPETDIGHIHLQVSDLDRSRKFYNLLLGLEVTQRSYPGALFLSAGGYHHHLGLNIWNSRGAQPSSAEHAGLISYEIKIPNTTFRQDLLARLKGAGTLSEETADIENSSRTLVYDPDSIRILI
ncbi:MAG TPA: VOC family protein [Anaerolineales bacterium]|nr:VOC family protein [Anaerolineales bacterium]